MPNPDGMRNQTNRPTYVKLAADRHQKLVAIAEARGCTVSDVIREAVQQYLGSAAARRLSIRRVK